MQWGAGRSLFGGKIVVPHPLNDLAYFRTLKEYLEISIA
jgi:hypothetical protein